MEVNLTEPKSNFILVRCQKCKNEQIIFNKLSSVVKCLVCDDVLAKSTGGKSKVNAQVLEVL